MSILIMLLITAFCTAIAAIVAIAFYGMYRTAQKGRDDFARAIPAAAKVAHVGESAQAEDYDTVDVTLTFEVNPPGGAPYRVKTIWSVDMASVAKIQEGNTVAIRIAADDRRKIYSDEKWAQSLELMQNALDDADD